MTVLLRPTIPTAWIALALCVAVGAFLALPVRAQSDERIVANFIEADVVIDGTLNEFNGAGYRIDLATDNNDAEVRLLWDHEALYVGIAVSDNQINAFIGERDGNVWREDSIELFFDVLQNGGNEMKIDDYQFILSALNTQFDARGDYLGRTSWNAAWESATRKSGTFNENEDVDEGYTYEVRIPWAQIGVDADAVEEDYDLGFSVAMNDWDQNERDLIMWGGHTSNFHDPDKWGTLVLGNEDAGVLECPIEEQDGRTIVDLTEDATRSREDLALRADAGSRNELDEVAVELAAGTYEVRMASFDWHSLQNSFGQDEERWEAVLYDNDGNELAVAGPTSDLPDDKDSMMEILDGTLELSEDAETLVARHAADEGVHSVAPVCVSFDETQTPEVSDDAEADDEADEDGAETDGEDDDEADAADDDKDEDEEMEDTDSSADDADDDVPPQPMAIVPTQSRPCHVYSAGRAVPEGYGAAFSFISPTPDLLIHALCDEQGILVELGDGNASTYIYHVGYEWTGDAWSEIAYAGDELIGEAWYTRSARAQLSRSPAELEESNYFVAFICQWDGGRWACGCADEQCAESYWMVQNARVGDGSSAAGDTDDQDDTDDSADANLYERLADDDRFETLVEAFENAGLDESLMSENVALTLFAPTDAAFEKLEEPFREGLLADADDTLATVLFYHLVDGLFDTAVLSESEELETLLDDTQLAVDLDSEGRLTVGGTSLVETDVEASNGVIHVVDDVLIPDVIDLDAYTGTSSATTTVSFALSAENYAFSETVLEVNEGDLVEVTVTASEGMHDFVIDEFDVTSALVQAGTATTTDTVSFVADTAGTYDFYCSVGNHRALGMEGTLLVE